MCRKEMAKRGLTDEDVLSRVAVVTNRHLAARPYLEQIRRVCQLHPAAVIVREKDLEEEDYARLAGQVLAICREYQVPCVYHTYPETALYAGVDAIHLPLALLKRYRETGILKKFTHVGTSVHSVWEAEEALRLGATCLTAGHIYLTDCKKGLPPRGTAFLQEICALADVPVWAIGGIHMGTGQMEEILSCGAAGGCIMSEMMRI